MVGTKGHLVFAYDLHFRNNLDGILDSSLDVCCEGDLQWDRDRVGCTSYIRGGI